MKGGRLCVRACHRSASSKIKRCNKMSRISKTVFFLWLFVVIMSPERASKDA